MFLSARDGYRLEAGARWRLSRRYENEDQVRIGDVPEGARYLFPRASTRFIPGQSLFYIAVPEKEEVTPVPISTLRDLS